MNEKTIKIEVERLTLVEGDAIIRIDKNDNRIIDSLRFDRIEEIIKNQLLIAYSNYWDSDKKKFEIVIKVK